MHSASEYLRTAHQLVEAGRFWEAIALYQQAICHYPTEAVLYRDFGVVLEQVGDQVGEIASYRKAIELNENQPLWVYTTLAYLLKQQGQFAEAIRFYQWAWRLSAGDRYFDAASSNSRSMVRAIEQDDRWGNALPNSPKTASWESEPERELRFEIARHLGECWTALNNFEMAIAAYEQALQLQPDRLGLQHRIGALRFSWGKQWLETRLWRQAIEQFQQIDQVKDESGSLIPWFGEGHDRWPWVRPSWMQQFEMERPIGQGWPLITVVTPSLNQGEYIEETILSVLNQQYACLEYVIVDGGSIDQTPEILRRYSDRITTVIVEADRGQSEAINKGMARATGELLLWLNSDDVLAPGALHVAALTYLQQHVEVIAGICLVHEQGKVIGMRQPRVRQSDFTVEHLMDIQQWWSSGHFFFQPEVVFSRRIWERVGGRLDETLHYAMDYELWMRFAAAGATLQVVGYPFALFRKHKAQKTANQSASIQELSMVVESWGTRALQRDRRIDSQPQLFPLQPSTPPALPARPRQLELEDPVDEGDHCYIEREPERAQPALAERLEQMFGQFFARLEQFELTPELMLWFRSGAIAELMTEAMPELKGETTGCRRSIWEYLEIGKALVDSAQWSAAIGLYRQALQQHPDQAEIYRSLGFAQEQVGDTEGELMNYQRAIELERRQPEWVYGVTANLLNDRRRWQAAIVVCRQGIELYPTQATLYRYLGFAQEHIGDVLGEIESYRKAIEIEPQPEWVYETLIELLNQQGDYNAALSITRLGLAQYPGRAILQQRLSELQLNRLQPCRSHDETILSSCHNAKLESLSENELKQRQNAAFPNTANLYQATLHRELGQVQEKMGDMAGGIASYRQAIELDANQPLWVYISLANLLQQQAKFSEAVLIYQTAVQLQPLVDQLYLRQAETHLSKGEFEQAALAYRQSITTRSHLEIVLFMPYHQAQTRERQSEYIYCLRRNIECREIGKIYLLIDDCHTPEIASSKVEVIRLAARPTYLDWIELTEQNCCDQISVLANTDIAFDETISLLRDLFSHDPTGFVALSRYEQAGSSQKLHQNPQWSQDVWAVLGQSRFSDVLKNALKIPLGTPRCDNKIAYLFSIQGAKVYNPCYQVKTVHIHETQWRSYDKKGDTTVLGATAWVYPSQELNKPAQLFIDVWTLNSDQVVGIQTNNMLVQWQQEQQQSSLKLEPKAEEATDWDCPSIIAFDADWQYPVITEKHAYVMLKQLLPEQNPGRTIVYFGFPWATLIDKWIQKQADKDEVKALWETLISFKDKLRNYQRVITVCQHIRLIEVEHFFNEIGITDIFWSHTIKEQESLPSYPHIHLHPFPLYPVQAIEAEEAKTISNDVARKYLYSFVGSRAHDYYLTDSRNKIIHYLSDDDRGVIVERNQWHYHKIVYEHQIVKRTEPSENLIDPVAADLFKQVMQQSIFALCPSGSGPNSIRLWEAIGLGAIPVILADTYRPPGDLALWYEAIVLCPETTDDIKALPDRLVRMQQNEQLLAEKRRALQQLWRRYGPDCFVYDIHQLFKHYASASNPVADRADIDSSTSTLAVVNQQVETQELDQSNFQPSYTWPNSALPFRLYYGGQKCRIFIIESFQYNWNWLAECHEQFRETDFFFVFSSWYQSPDVVQEVEAIFSQLSLNKSQFFFLYNSSLEMQNFSEQGFYGEVINQNAWLDDLRIAQPQSFDKSYHAIYVDFEKQYKRSMLAAQIPQLALVALGHSATRDPALPPYAYLNNQPLSSEAVYQKICQAHCGLILSEEEGSCPTSSEYLLCGLPVVSTPSKGGRDVWYNDYNAIICEPTMEAVAAAVEELVRSPRDPQRIRRMYIEQSRHYRLKFVRILSEVFDRFGITDVDSSVYFSQNFHHKMIKVETIETVQSYFANGVAA